MSVCQRSFIVKRMQAWINTISLLDSTSPLPHVGGSGEALSQRLRAFVSLATAG